jgi:hypothetical protein
MLLGNDDVAFLESMDTPTVCNVIEIVAPERRGHGYTTRHLHCAFPDLRLRCLPAQSELDGDPRS